MSSRISEDHDYQSYWTLKDYKYQKYSRGCSLQQKELRAGGGTPYRNKPFQSGKRWARACSSVNTGPAFCESFDIQAFPLPAWKSKDSIKIAAIPDTCPQQTIRTVKAGIILPS